MDADAVEIPSWVLPEHRIQYREITARCGEEDAAAWARKAKAGNFPAGATAPVDGRGETSVWPAARIEAMKRMWTAGSSASAIAAEIGGTRYAILSKISQLGLQRGGASRKTPPVARASTLAAPRPVFRARAARKPPEGFEPPATSDTSRQTQDPPAPPAGPPGGILFADAKMFQCRWIIGPSEDGARCCGAPHRPESRFWFCDRHLAIGTSSRQTQEEKRLAAELQRRGAL